MNELSIIVACPEKGDVLPSLIKSMAEFLTGNPGDVEVIVVVAEDQSSVVVDDLLRSKPAWLKIRILQKTGEGRHIGSYLRFAMAHSSSRYIMLLSPYGDNELSMINQIMSKLRNGAQLVQVARAPSIIGNDTNAPLFFSLYRKLYLGIARILTGIDSPEVTYGYKGFDRSFIQAIGVGHFTHTIFPELVMKAHLAGGRIDYVESKVSTSYMGQKFSLLRHGPGYLWVLIRASLHRFKLLRWF